MTVELGRGATKEALLRDWDVGHVQVYLINEQVGETSTEAVESHIFVPSGENVVLITLHSIPKTRPRFARYMPTRSRWRRELLDRCEERKGRKGKADKRGLLRAIGAFQPTNRIY